MFLHTANYYLMYNLWASVCFYIQPITIWCIMSEPQYVLTTLLNSWQILAKMFWWTSFSERTCLFSLKIRKIFQKYLWGFPFLVKLQVYRCREGPTLSDCFRKQYLQSRDFACSKSTIETLELPIKTV